MTTIRKQYSSNYQVFEIIQEVDSLDKETIETVCAKMDEIASTEIKNMLEVVGVQDQQKTSTASQKTDNSAKASEKQLAVIKKNLQKCKLIASDLGIALDSNTLSMKDAKQIIDKLFNANNSGF